MMDNVINSPVVIFSIDKYKNLFNNNQVMTTMNKKKKVMIIEKGMNPLKRLSNGQLSKLIGGLLPCNEFDSCALIFRGSCVKFSGDCGLYNPPKEEEAASS
jgi:hypothetical protein